MPQIFLKKVFQNGAHLSFCELWHLKRIDNKLGGIVVVDDACWNTGSRGIFGNVFCHHGTAANGGIIAN